MGETEREVAERDAKTAREISDLYAMTDFEGECYRAVLAALAAARQQQREVDAEIADNEAQTQWDDDDNGARAARNIAAAIRAEGEGGNG
ncbi:MAG TPA: hypothetical protein VIX17_11725 [Pyrinomonadaceae bacterium]|jgi:hypothetical protein